MRWHRLVAVALLGLCGCAGDIVIPPSDTFEGKDQVREALKGSDFRRKTAARQELQKMEPAERLEILDELLAEPDAGTRLIAVSELSKLPPESVKERLEKLAAEDPDEDVKMMAAMALGQEPAEVPPDETPPPPPEETGTPAPPPPEETGTPAPPPPEETGTPAPPPPEETGTPPADTPPQ
jgi:hypothetical protein